MTLDQLLRDAGDHVDALIDRHLMSASSRGDTTTPLTSEVDIMTIVEQPPRGADSTTPLPRRRWTVYATVAAAAALVVAGFVALQRGRGDDATDIAPPSSLVVAASVQDNLIGKTVFDGRNLWSVRTGSTFLLQMRPDTGAVIRSHSLPEAASEGDPVLHDGSLYVPTTHGVVVVDTQTGVVSGPKAAADSAVWSVAFTTDAVWMVRRLPNEEVLERWTATLDERTVSVDLGPEESVGIVGAGDSLYFATAHDGLKRYDSNGTVQATVPGVETAWDMEVDDDGTLWIADWFHGDLVAVDTTTDTVRSRTTLSTNDVMNVAVTPSSVWVTLKTDQRLVVVDPVTGRVTTTAPLKGTPLALTLANGAAWVSGEGGWAERFVPG